MLTKSANRRFWLLSKAFETCSSLAEALQLAREAEAFLALSDDAEAAVPPARALQPSTAEVDKAKITAAEQPEAQRKVLVAAGEIETQVATIPEPSCADNDSDAPSSSAVSSLSVFAVPEDVLRYLCRQGIPVEATATGEYKIEGRLEPLSLLRTRANALRIQQNLPPLELMPIPAIQSQQNGKGAPPSRLSSDKGFRRSTGSSAVVPTELVHRR